METIPDNSRGLNDHLFQSFFNKSPSPAWMVDEDGYILFMNAHALKVWNLDHPYIHKQASGLFPKAIIDRFAVRDLSMLTSAFLYHLWPRLAG